MIRGLMSRCAVLLVGACRMLYCWMFLCWSLTSLYVSYTRFQHSLQTSSLDRGAIFSNTVLGIYAIVLGVAWYTIFKGSRSLKRWAIAACFVFIFTYVPGLVSGDWRGVVKDELAWWPVILIGTFGIIVFSVPYHGWRRKSLRATE